MEREEQSLLKEMDATMTVPKLILNVQSLTPISFGEEDVEKPIPTKDQWLKVAAKIDTEREKYCSRKPWWTCADPNEDICSFSGGECHGVSVNAANKPYYESWRELYENIYRGMKRPTMPTTSIGGGGAKPQMVDDKQTGQGKSHIHHSSVTHTPRRKTSTKGRGRASDYEERVYYA